MNQYQLSRFFWDYSFENTGKLKPNHIALYFFAMEHCNRLGWKKQFGLPTSMVLDAINIKSYSVYKSTFDDLVEMGFFEVVEYSKNQYSSNIIALKENYKANYKANDKALDKALTKHMSKHFESTLQSTCESTDSIDKPITNNQEQESKEEKITPADLSKSNLFRQPIVPTIHQVQQAFVMKGGTIAMADKFYNEKASVDWFHKGNPVTNFQNLIGGYIENWKRFENKGRSPDLQPAYKLPDANDVAKKYA